MKRTGHALLIPILITLLTLPLILPYFQSGFFPTHDGEWAVVRLSDMYREIKDGQIPPRYSGNLNFGYGYPLFQYAYPMPYYLGLVLYLFQFGLVDSIKILFAVSVPLSAICMYFAAKELFASRFGALVSALLYAYLPYRMVDLYVRGSLGESLASIYFPVLLLGIIRMSKNPTWPWAGVVSLLFASLILTHNIMAVLFSMVIGAYLLFLGLTKKLRLLLPVIISLLLGAGMAAFFWLPALGEKNLIVLSRIPIADRDLYYVPFQELLYSPWGYGIPTAPDRFTYQIGPVHVVLFLIVAGLSLQQFLRKRLKQKEIIVFLLSVPAFVIMLFPFSAVLWEHLPLLKEINYPWTLLLPIGFLVSLSAGALDPKRSVSKAAIMLLVVIMMVMVYPYARPLMHVDRGEGYYFTNDATTTSSRELMPLWVKTLPEARLSEKVVIASGAGTIALQENRSHRIHFRADLREESVIRVNTIYFPNWRWYQGETAIPFTYDNPHAVMEARLPSGQHDLRVDFENTPLRTVSNFLSLLSFFGFIGYSYFLIRERKHSS